MGNVYFYLFLIYYFYRAKYRWSGVGFNMQLDQNCIIKTLAKRDMTRLVTGDVMRYSY